MKKLLFTFLSILLGPLSIAQNNLPVDMILVKSGTLEKQANGNTSSNTKGSFSDEIASFYMSATEVSVQDFKQFCKETKKTMPPEPDWGWGDPKKPIVNVTYADALAYCDWLSDKHGMSYTLPTHQQWEYAARGGNFDNPDFVNNKQLPNSFVIYIGNSNEKPECITCIQRNELGFYALCGNVWEWVLNGPRQQGHATVVGGSFFEGADQVRIGSHREYNKYLRRQDIGFRVVMNPE